MIFETHSHYDDRKFDADRAELLCSMKENNVDRLINVGSSLATTVTSIQLAHTYDFVYAAAGVHPDEVGELTEENFVDLAKQADDPRVVAIGEIGLDYYRKEEEKANYKLVQKYWFKKQLELAGQKNLPVIIHSRDAAQDTADILLSDEFAGICGVMHCYSYSKELALQYIKSGFYIGVGGVVTFKNGRKLRETVEAIPLTSILLETDCPYMAPEPHRGTRNDSTMIQYMVAKIAEIKGVTTQEVEDVTYANTLRLFGKVK